jgi:hypothetical protein
MSRHCSPATTPLQSSALQFSGVLSKYLRQCHPGSKTHILALYFPRYLIVPDIVLHLVKLRVRYRHDLIPRSPCPFSASTNPHRNLHRMCTTEPQCVTLPPLVSEAPPPTSLPSRSTTYIDLRGQQRLGSKFSSLYASFPRLTSQKSSHSITSPPFPATLPTKTLLQGSGRTPHNHLYTSTTPLLFRCYMSHIRGQQGTGSKLHLHTTYPFPRLNVQKPNHPMPSSALP